MFYNGWEVTNIRDGWKATKNGNSMYAVKAALLKAMINEQEGLPIRPPEKRDCKKQRRL